MKWRLILISLILASVASAAPIVNPTNCFTGWPWTDQTNKSWMTVDTNKHLIKQITVQLKDRCEAAGIWNMPAYNNTFTLSAYIKTNYVYQNWAYWTPVTNIFANTNQCATNYNPHIQLYEELALWNIYGPTNYYTPKNIDINNSGLSNGVFAPAVTRAMMNSWASALDSALTNYMPSWIDIDAYSTNKIAEREEFPYYIMGELMTNANVGAVSNIVRDSYGVMTNCDWVWANALPGFAYSSTNSVITQASNSVITLKGLTDLAAMIAQLKNVKVHGVSCSPAAFRSYSGYGWNANGAPISSDWVKYSGADYYRFSTNYSFAWAASSTDQTWFTTFQVNPNWGSTNEFLFDLPWNVVAHEDWPNNGWFANLAFDLTLNALRDPNSYYPATTSGGSNWTISLFGLHTPDQIANTITISAERGSLSIPTNNSRVGIYYVGTEQVMSESMEGYTFYTKIPAGDPVTITTHSNQTVDASTYNTIDFFLSILSNKVEAEDHPFTLLGSYLSNTTDINGAVIDHTRVSLTFNNTEYMTNRYVGSNDVPNNSSSQATYDVHTNIVTSTYQTTFPYDYYTWANPAADAQMATGTASVANQASTEGVIYQENIYSIRTGFTQVRTTDVVKAYVFLKGCNAYNKPLYAPMGSTNDWALVSFDFSALNERNLLAGGVGDIINTKAYTNVFEYTSVPTEAAKSIGGCDILVFSNMYKNAIANNYVPYSEEVLSRKFWGVTNAFFVIRYAFTNKF